jgi:4-diphosphocytidyl-2-C-methyl-D-erythritol kinase
MEFHSPAKINFRLKVIGRRPDGYHELVSIMVPVGLCDTIEVRPSPKQGVQLSCSGLFVPEGEENLVLRACQVFFVRTGLEPRLSIKLVKNIPVAAGLGGGSSNAASTLMALNEMFSEPLSFSELKELALALGADVPFFLYRKPCMARGIGEVLEPISNWPQFWYVIVMPPIAVSTAWVYANLKLELTNNKYNGNLHSFSGDSGDIASLLENDLETVTDAHYPVIGFIKQALLDTGAKGALMSGSGPSVFGIFESENHARRAERQLISQAFGTVYVVSG